MMGKIIFLSPSAVYSYVKEELGFFVIARFMIHLAMTSRKS